MKTFNLIFSLLFLFVSISSADVTGTKLQGPALIEGFNAVASAAGTTTLTKDSQTKQILTGTTTQTYVLPDATTLPLSRKFLFINKSTGTATIQTSGGGALSIVSAGKQKEFHLRAAGSAAGTWDELDISGGGGGAWGGITGTLSDQTDLQSALDAKAPTASPTFSGTIGTPLTASRLLATDGSGNLSASTVTTTTAGYLDPTSSVQTQLNTKAPLASPTFTGTIGTPLTASKLLATDASGNLTATAANSSQATYLDFTSSGQTQLNGKLGLSNFSAKGDIVAGVSSGTVSSLTLGGEGSYLLSDPNNITNGVRWGTPAGLTNYVKQSQAEGGVTTGWATYADAAGTSPVDGTGGSPNSTFSSTSTNPLRGSNSFTFTLNTGATRQGEGVCYPFTIDRADTLVPKQQKIEFDYEITSGTFVAGNMTDISSAGDSTLTVWVVDTTSGQVMQPSTYRLYSNVSDHYTGYFQNNYNSANYRVCLHKGTSATVSGSNIVVKLDEFKVAPSTYLAGTTITDWQSYTPTFTGFGTVTNISFKSRRVGDSLEIKGYFTTGTNTATQAQITLGYAGGNANVTVDTTKIQTGSIIGVVGNSGSGSTYFGSYALSPSSAQNYFNIAAQTSTTGALTAVNGSTFANASNMSVDLVVPISGWSSSTQMSDGYDGRLLVSRANGSQSLSNNSETTVDLTTTVIDKAGSIDLSANTITVKSAGLYRITAKVSVGAPAGATFNGYLNLRKNGATNETLDVRTFTTTGFSGTAYLSGSTILDAVAGDYYDLRVFQQNGSSASATTDSVFIVEKLQSPQTMSATEVVAAKYKSTAGQSISDSTVTTLTHSTKVYDTHGAVSSGSFIAPVSGLYQVEGFAFWASSAGWSSLEVTHMIAYVDGVGDSYMNSWTGQAAVASLQPALYGSTKVWLNAGQVATVRIFQNSGGSLSLTTNADQNWIAFTRIK